ncbi:MAG TPA: response regulator transcription factor [Acidimicrobiia bacterium]|nr:response regulator transcription factor [Acidimicrobiia bacterium]
MGAEIRVLVVGDDAVDGFAERVLKEEGWEVLSATSAEALDRVEGLNPDLVVLHIQRFGLGLELCAAVRARSRVPVMVLSRSSAEDDVVAGLRSGADAIVVEGIGSHEFVARVRALLRRVPPPRRHEPVDAVIVGPVTLNRATRQVTVSGALVPLPRREFDILEVLMRNADRTVNRATLRRQLWGISRDSRTLDVQVRRLRGRLASAEGRRRIITERGVGYRFASTVEGAPGDTEIDLTAAALSCPSDGEAEAGGDATSDDPVSPGVLARNA